MDSEVIISLLNELKNLLYSKPNLKLISEQAIILYQDLKLFSFDLYYANQTKIIQSKHIHLFICLFRKKIFFINIDIFILFNI
jgi:hypothetical protein